MPKLRHIALATKDPEATAAFYCKAFDFKEVGRVGDRDDPDNGLAWGIYLSCLLYTSPSPRDATLSRIPSSS